MFVSLSSLRNVLKTTRILLKGAQMEVDAREAVLGPKGLQKKASFW